jgi:hypothetical protein
MGQTRFVVPKPPLTVFFTEDVLTTADYVETLASLTTHEGELVYQMG